MWESAHTLPNQYGRLRMVPTSGKPRCWHRGAPLSVQIAIWGGICTPAKPSLRAFGGSDWLGNGQAGCGFQRMDAAATQALFQREAKECRRSARLASDPTSHAY